MKNDLSLYVAQYYPAELIFGLSKLKSDMNILYSNCISTLNIGNQIIETDQFDTFLYNEDHNMLILLMRNGCIKKSDLVRYLELNKNYYSEIIFNISMNEYAENDVAFDISLVNKKYMLEGELNDALLSGKKSCEFYSNINGILGLGYLTNSNENINLYSITIESLIKFDDKLILIINQNNYGEKDKIDENVVFNVIKNRGFNCEFILNKEPDLFDDKFIKMLKK